MDTVKILDKTFKKSISYEQIQEAIGNVAEKLNNDLKDKDVIFLGILNGAFMFAADLFKKININCQISFLKVVSSKASHPSDTIHVPYFFPTSHTIFKTCFISVGVASVTISTSPSFLFQISEILIIFNLL